MRKTLLTIALCGGFFATMAQEIYKDPSRSVSERTEDLLSRMTLEEKIGQMDQADYNDLTKEDRKSVV